VKAAHRAALFGCYALATFLAFPHPVLGTVVDLGWVASWLAPLFLILALRGLTPRRALRLGFLAGLLAHSAVLHWIYVVTVTYGHALPVVGLIAPVLLAAWIAGFTALFGVAVAWLERRGLASPFAIAAVWTALDHLRSFAFTGFPWATLGYAQHQNLALMPLVAWTGVYGLSFLSVLGAAAVSRFFTVSHLAADSPPRGRPCPCSGVGDQRVEDGSRLARDTRRGAPGQHRSGGEVVPGVGGADLGDLPAAHPRCGG
jgi:apolipoprotein N-acyltransferase